MARATCSNCGYPYAVSCQGCPNCGASLSCGCFVTSAVVSHLGRTDDCEELQAFRAFRDSYMIGAPDREADVDLYYHVAPAIVALIDASSARDALYASLWDEHLAPSYDAIRSGNYPEARTLYTRMMQQLISRYLSRGE